ncbi:YbaL family putative K(+) efflux transporter [Sphingobium lignivorans]|uniref:CPA2 family monovalent cation:H+ antiporter-2 n=1 Tax=Sphingobium lignivorans TaxID=2735886 RepID=A0ABR6NJB6_9SPHN|nr:YbaL family putative K(+) efflux transporter [Sphingobium lignivorans]MBB5987356.1 CPA2 family monovalent cation:H+ antiporter-2 [Sphingobium lignivorans]
MPHYTPLIATIVAGFVVSFIMGAIAMRLRVSPIAGYLLAGVLVGPFTPGFVADTNLANELAEIGVILLMFGVGLHFSLKDLLSVRRIAVPGAIAQIATATLLGMGLAWALGWDPLAGFGFGLALSVASTVVLLRALQSRDLVETERGRIAVGWLIVEDLVMVLALVLLPVLAGMVRNPAGTGILTLALPLGLTFLKVGAFVALMLIVGRRVIPWALHWVVHTGSRELFRLAVLAIALGVAAGSAFIFDVSFALGAFFAGMILGETPLSRRATEETLPLRDAFAVLFFVSVGMLFDPRVVLEQPLPVLATVFIIVLGKSVAAFYLVRAFGYNKLTATTVAASLAQIGEFSFILATLGIGLGIMPESARDLILAGAIFSIVLNPVIFSYILRKPKDEPTDEPAAAEEPLATTLAPAAEPSRAHILLIGYGRVGQLLASQLKARDEPLTVIESDEEKARAAEQEGHVTIYGNGIDSRILLAGGVDRASALLIAIPEGFDAGVIAEKARNLKPGIRIIARAHSDAEVEHLTRLGVGDVVMGEHTLAMKMLDLACSQRTLRAMT